MKPRGWSGVKTTLKSFETLYLREIHRSAILELDLILPQYIDNQSLNWSIGIHKYSSWIQTTFMVATNMSHSRHVRRGQRAVGITHINFTVATCVMCTHEQCDDGWEQRKFGDRIQAFWDRFRCYFTAEEQNAVLANRLVTIQLCTSQSFPRLLIMSKNAVQLQSIHWDTIVMFTPVHAVES